MYEGFTRTRVPTRLGEINVVHGGKGPPLLLLHGYLQTHVSWHIVAPRLMDRFHVIVADLPGHGDSDKSEPGPNFVNYAKRTMGEAMIDLMASFGYDRFNLGGHDRGGRVGYRLALDHPEKIIKLCVLDMIPGIETFEAAQRDFRNCFPMWHWFFLAQKAPLPEAMLELAPEEYVRNKIALNLVQTDAITPEAMNEYVRCFSNPATIHATCNDYRATASIDLEHDEENRRKGEKITLPTMVIMGGKGEAAFEMWRRWVVDPICIGIENCGHYVPEEGAETVTKHFREFFGD